MLYPLSYGGLRGLEPAPSVARSIPLTPICRRGYFQIAVIGAASSAAPTNSVIPKPSSSVRSKL